MIRVVVLEDHPLMMEIIADKLGKQTDIELVGTDSHGSRLFELVHEKSPNVVILNLSMGTPDFKAFVFVDTLRRDYPDLHIMILTVDDSPACIHAMIRAGVKGYVLKSDVNFAGNLADAIRAIYAGEHYYSPGVQKVLSKQEERQPLNEQAILFLQYLSNGLSRKAIVDATDLTEKRVNNIFSIICDKMGGKENDQKIDT